MTLLSVYLAPKASRLVGVEYEWADVDEELQTSEDFDYSSIAISLMFADGDRYRLRWRDERLTSIDCASRDPQPDRTVNASRRWGSVIGAHVKAQTVGWGGSEWGRQIWCTRIDFDNGRSIVVALGELEAHSGHPRYLPDALLITDREHAARQYRPVASEASAWIESAGQILD